MMMKQKICDVQPQGLPAGLVRRQFIQEWCTHTLTPLPLTAANHICLRQWKL